MKKYRNSKLSVASEILRAAGHLTSASLPSEILLILSRHLPIAAASFYSFYDMGGPNGNSVATPDKLTLRAQHGFRYQDFTTFLLSPDSLAGQALRERRIIRAASPNWGNDEHLRAMTTNADHSAVVIAPLYVDRKLHPTEIEPPATGRLGVIFAYVAGPGEMTLVKRALTELGPIISEAYVQTIDVDKLRLRDQITQRAVASADANSFLYRFARVLTELWPYEAVSVYTYDDRADILRLGATTGLRSKRPKHEVYIPLDDPDAIEVVCLKKRVARLYFLDPAQEEEDPRAEVLGGTPVARMYVPIFEPATTQANAIGIIRVTNKLLRHDGRTETLSFGWEDISFLRFASDVAGVILSLFSRVTKAKDDFERSMHGVQNNLNGVLGSLGFVTALVERTRSDDLRRHSYLLPTASAQLQALAWQIERLSSRAQSHDSGGVPCHLLSDVFAKLGPLLRPLAVSFNATIDRLPTFNELFQNSPPIRMSANQVLTVFRNLFENSFKYSDPGDALIIEMKVVVVESSNLVHIHYRDNGIGVNERDAARLFFEGFRSEDAMRRCTTGAGLGLFQCKEIVSRSSGDISIVHLRKPTEFVVSLPIWRER